MTVLEIKDDVRRNLNDTGITFYTAKDLTDAVQDAYDEVVVETGCIEKCANFPFLANKIYYDYYSSISDFMSVVGIFSYNRKQWLNYISMRELGQRDNWERVTGSPRWFTPINYRYTALTNWSTAASGVHLLLYRAKPETLGDTSVPSMPYEFHHILGHYATAVCLEKNKEFQKANVFHSMFREDLAPLNTAVKNRAGADRLFVLSPYIELGRFGWTGNDMWIDNEEPDSVGSSTTVFDLDSVPNPSNSLLLFKDGTLLYAGIGYTLSGARITLTTPITTEELRAWYRTA